MPANKYALLRYRIIDRCIGNPYKPFPNKEDLRRACEEELYGSQGDYISDSTIEKDLYAMRNELNLGYHAPIAYSKVHKGYYYTEEGYSIDKFPLSEEEADAIRLAANTLSQFRGIDLFKTSESAIDKILDRLSLTPAGSEKAVEEHVQFETAPSYSGGAYLKDLFSAITRKRVVHFAYAKFTGGKERQYTLHPYLLKEYRNRWYVIGWNPDKQAVVVFGLDRIKGPVALTDQYFERRSDFDPDLYFKHSLGITAINEAPEQVHLRFSPLSGKYVASQPWHHSQQVVRDDEVALEVTMALCITRELVMQVLSYGADVEVKAPQKLRDQVARELRKAMRPYGD